MSKAFATLCLFASVANAQKEPNFIDIMTIADNYVKEAGEFLKASKGLSESAMLSKVEDLNGSEIKAFQASQGADAGSIKDYSFLEQKQSPVAGVLRTVLSRDSDLNEAPGSSTGDYERKTQAPMIWLKLTKPSSFLKVEPAFPGASLEAAGKISETVKSVTKSQKFREAAAGSKSALSALISSAKHKLAEQVTDANKLASLKKDAYLGVHENLLRSIYVGGCPRDYAASKCPIDWEQSGSMCVPSGTYTGLCGPQNVGAMSAEQVEDFAWKCRAQWPCTSGCAKNFDACPKGWSSNADGACVAPQGYSGICSPVTNLSKFSTEQKAAWASMCGASFSCA